MLNKMWTPPNYGLPITFSLFSLVFAFPLIVVFVSFYTLSLLRPNPEKNKYHAKEINASIEAFHARQKKLK